MFMDDAWLCVSAAGKTRISGRLDVGVPHLWVLCSWDNIGWHVRTPRGQETTDLQGRTRSAAVIVDANYQSWLEWQATLMPMADPSLSNQSKTLLATWLIG